MDEQDKDIFSAKKEENESGDSGMTFLIKLKKAGEMKGAVGALAGIGGAATLEVGESGLVIRVIHPTRNLIAVLKVKASGADHYSCDRTPYFLHLSLPDLFAALDADDVLTLSSVDPSSSLLLVGRRRQMSISVTETTTASRWTTDESAYQYCLSLPSPHFRHIFSLLQQFDHTVKISITEKVAKLSGGLVHVLLRKEEKECVIQGVSGSSRGKVRVSLEHLEWIMKASQVTEGGVWIYNSTAEPPIRPLITCPLGPLGTLLFFLPRPLHFSSASSSSE